MTVNKTNYTWNDLYKRAIGTSRFSQELRAKDEARGRLAELITEECGYDIEKRECPEEEIENFLCMRKHPVLFDERGNVTRR